MQPWVSLVLPRWVGELLCFSSLLSFITLWVTYSMKQFFFNHCWVWWNEISLGLNLKTLVSIYDSNYRCRMWQVNVMWTTGMTFEGPDLFIFLFYVIGTSNTFWWLKGVLSCINIRSRWKYIFYDNSYDSIQSSWVATQIFFYIDYGKIKQGHFGK